MRPAEHAAALLHFSSFHLYAISTTLQPHQDAQPIEGSGYASPSSIKSPLLSECPWSVPSQLFCSYPWAKSANSMLDSQLPEVAKDHVHVDDLTLLGTLTSELSVLRLRIVTGLSQSHCPPSSHLLPTPS